MPNRRIHTDARKEQSAPVMRDVRLFVFLCALCIFASSR